MKKAKVNMKDKTSDAIIAELRKHPLNDSKRFDVGFNLEETLKTLKKSKERRK